jgi:hypothetical protein
MANLGAQIGIELTLLTNQIRFLSQKVIALIAEYLQKKIRTIISQQPLLQIQPPDEFSVSTKAAFIHGN